MNLFDDIEREPATSMSNLYSAFVAVNKDGSPGEQDRRDKLESWFQKFPDEGRNDLRRRFRSVLHDAHEGAFFELFLHELMINLGLKVEHVHPTLPDSSNHPDLVAGEVDPENWTVG